MKIKKDYGFTLVELIVVVTILAILSTIGFVSYSGYLAGTRDTNRISQIKSISDGLELYRTKHYLPLPDDYVEVQASGSIIAYQGYAGKNVLDMIEYTSEGIDPKDGIYYSYYLTKDKKYFQLMAFLEESDSLQNQAKAVDYSIRYPTVYGKKLGILTDENNTPIQEIASIKSFGKIELDGTNSGTIYNAHFSDGKVYSFSGKILNHILYTRSKPDIYGPPKGCPDGFVGLWGNSEFEQPGFCLAQYEMSYDASEDIVKKGVAGLSPTKTDWNIYDREQGRKIASRRGGYPIAYISQGEAIEACKSLGKGFHLQTEHEWMAMARDVELQGENWSGKELLAGYISNGNSNDSAHGCSIDLSNASDPEYTGRRWAAPVGFKQNDSCNESRKYITSNGAIIWDIGGNLREHVNKANTISGAGYNVGKTSFAPTGEVQDWDYADFVSIKKEHGPLFAKNATLHGIGKVEYPIGLDNNVFIRGGCAVCAANDGLYGIGLDGRGGDKQYNRGFRCAYSNR